MNVLVIGNGGREHALCYGIKQSPNCSNLYCIPGSDAISKIASSINTDVNDDYLTPGRKRLLENKKSQIDWDINQDSNYDQDISSNNSVFHKKYGSGVIINTESDTAEVKFQKFGIKKVYIKYLLPKI